MCYALYYFFCPFEYDTSFVYHCEIRQPQWYNKDITKDRHLLEQYEICDAHRIGEEALMVKKDEEEEWDDIINVGISEYERLIKAVDDFSDEYNRLRKKK